VTLSHPETFPDRVEKRTLPLRQSIEAPRSFAFTCAVKLTEEQQEAVILRIEFGLSYEEIARVLGRPSGNSVRMQVGRALVRLAEEMSSS
jgi:hypothetical protein